MEWFRCIGVGNHNIYTEYYDIDDAELSIGLRENMVITFFAKNIQYQSIIYGRNEMPNYRTAGKFDTFIEYITDYSKNGYRQTIITRIGDSGKIDELIDISDLMDTDLFVVTLRNTFRRLL